MERTLTYQIPVAFAGHKISEFLRGKGYSQTNLAMLKREEGSVCLSKENQKALPVRLNERLCGGECLIVHIRETSVSLKVPPVELPFPIVYEDEDMVVVNKPAGMPVHPSMNHYENTLGNAAAYYYGQQGKSFVYRCVNRLDRDTTGLTIIAKHTVSCGILYSAVEKREVCREYLAIVDGESLPDSGVIDLPLGRKPDSAIERMVDKENGDRAVTHYRVLGRGGGVSFLLLWLETGRTHQIRVHMKAVGHPLLGDFLYYPEDQRMDRQALHAGRLIFQHPITGIQICLEAPLPEDMRRVLEEAGIYYGEYAGG